MGPSYDTGPDSGDAVSVLHQPGHPALAVCGCAVPPAAGACGGASRELSRQGLTPPAPSCTGPYVPKLSLSQLYDWRWISFGTFQGCMVAAANLTNGLLAAAYLRFVVRHPGLTLAGWLAGCLL